MQRIGDELLETLIAESVMGEGGYHHQALLDLKDLRADMNRLRKLVAGWILVKEIGVWPPIRNR